MVDNNNSSSSVSLRLLAKLSGILEQIKSQIDKRGQNTQQSHYVVNESTEQVVQLKHIKKCSARWKNITLLGLKSYVKTWYHQTTAQKAVPHKLNCHNNLKQEGNLMFLCFVDWWYGSIFCQPETTTMEEHHTCNSNTGGICGYNTLHYSTA